MKKVAVRITVVALLSSVVAFFAAPKVKAVLYPEAPLCGDPDVMRDVKTLLVKAAGREMMDVIGIAPGEQQTAMLDEQTKTHQPFIAASISTEAVMMSGYDEKTKKRACQADLKAGDSKVASAEYTIQLTEDEKQYVVYAKFNRTDGKPPKSYVEIVRAVFPDIGARIDEVAESERIEKERRDRIIALNKELDETVEATKKAWRSAPVNLRILFPKTDYEISMKFSDTCNETDNEERLACQIETATKVHDFIIKVTTEQGALSSPVPSSPSASQSASGYMSDRPV